MYKHEKPRFYPGCVCIFITSKKYESVDGPDRLMDRRTVAGTLFMFESRWIGLRYYTFRCEYSRISIYVIYEMHHHSLDKNVFLSSIHINATETSIILYVWKKLKLRNNFFFHVRFLLGADGIFRHPENTLRRLSPCS